MDDLIKRLEEAKEGSRDLDYAIAETLGREKIREQQGTFAPWKYTTSLDAALTLVPDGWIAKDMRQRDEALKYSHASALVAPKNGNDAGWAKYGKVSPEGKALTLPLALCIAALRARAQEGCEK